MAHSKEYKYFIDLLYDIAEADQRDKLDGRQIEILQRLEFFDCFGNQTELAQIVYIFTTILKNGKAKSIRKEKAEECGLTEVFAKHANGLTKSGEPSKSWTQLDMSTIMHGAEDYVKSLNIPDLSLAEKARRYADVAGYVGFVTGQEKDRNILYVKDVTPVKRRSDGKVFGYSVAYQSIGSGVDNRMTVFKGTFDKDPIAAGDVIKCLKYSRDGKYFQLKQYAHVA